MSDGFFNAWVAKVRSPAGVMLYGYGKTEEEARGEVLSQLPAEFRYEDSDVTTMETHRATGS